MRYQLFSFYSKYILFNVGKIVIRINITVITGMSMGKKSNSSLHQWVMLRFYLHTIYGFNK